MGQIGNLSDDGMGGILSGWYGRRSSRHTTDDFRSINVRHVARKSGMTPGVFLPVPWIQAGRQVGLAKVLIRESELVINGEIAQLRWIAWSLAGARFPMLTCPLCFRRCYVLYWHGDRCKRSRLGCVVCLDLAWPVERESRRRRAVRRAWRTLKQWRQTSRHRRRITDSQLDAAGAAILEEEERPSRTLARMQFLSSG